MIYSSLEPNEELTARQRRRLRRTEAIEDAALRLIGQHGVDGWTMADLAKANDLTPGALYRYFRSKDEIIAQIQLRVMNALVRAWQEAEAQVLATSPCSSRRLVSLSSLLAAAWVHERLAADHPERFALLTMSIADPKPLVRDEAMGPVKQATLALMGRVTQVIGEARSGGAFAGGDGCASRHDDAQRAVLWIFGSHGLLQLHKLAHRIPGLVDVSAVAQRLRWDLLTAWGADPQDLALAESAVRAALAPQEPHVEDFTGASLT